MRYLLLQWPKTGILWERLLFVVRVGDNPRQLGGWLDGSFASLELCPFFLILYIWKERTGLSFRDVGTIYSMLKYLLCFFLEWMRVGSHNATLVEGLDSLWSEAFLDSLWCGMFLTSSVLLHLHCFFLAPLYSIYSGACLLLLLLTYFLASY